MKAQSACAAWLLNFIVNLILIILGFSGVVLCPRWNSIHDFFTFDSFNCFIAGLLCWSFLFNAYLGVGRHFDKKFKPVLVNDPDISSKIIFIFFPVTWLVQLKFMRAVQYARALIMGHERAQKNYALDSWFGTFDFRKEASWLDSLFAVFLLCMSLIILMAVIFYGIRSVWH